MSLYVTLTLVFIKAVTQRSVKMCNDVTFLKISLLSVYKEIPRWADYKKIKNKSLQTQQLSVRNVKCVIISKSLTLFLSQLQCFQNQKEMLWLTHHLVCPPSLFVQNPLIIFYCCFLNFTRGLLGLGSLMGLIKGCQGHLRQKKNNTEATRSGFKRRN